MSRSIEAIEADLKVAVVAAQKAMSMSRSRVAAQEVGAWRRLEALRAELAQAKEDEK